jgi:hypothetical protein
METPVIVWSAAARRRFYKARTRPRIPNKAASCRRTPNQVHFTLPVKCHGYSQHPLHGSVSGQQGYFPLLYLFLSLFLGTQSSLTL